MIVEHYRDKAELGIPDHARCEDGQPAMRGLRLPC